LASCIDNVVIGFEDAIGEPVGAQILPDVLDRVQLWRARRQEDRRDIVGHVEIGCGVPPRAVHEQHRVRPGGDVAADLVEMELHGVGVGQRQSERRAFCVSRTDGAEEVGAFIALVGRLTRPRTAAGPLPDETVLLADARLVLEPDFNPSIGWQTVQMGAQRAREVFLKASMISAS